MSRYIGNYVRVPSTEPAQASAPGIWSISEQLAYQRNNQWPVSRDPYYNQTVLHLTGSVPNTSGPQTMNLPLAYNSDASSNNFVITPNGDVSPRPFSPYMGNNYSVYFPGSTARIQFPSGNIIPSSGTYTIECWIYPTSLNATYGAVIASQGTTPSGDNGRTGLSITAAGILTFGIGESFPSFTSGSTTIKLNQWTHVAITRNNTIFTMYINGNRINQVTSSKTTDAGFLRLGTLWDGDGNGLVPYVGYISNFRIVYSVLTDFTNRTDPLTPITNTALLACQSNRFIDNSTNNYSPTVVGGAQVTDNSPFVSTDFTTGAGYFDGTTDWLSVGDQTAFEFGSGDYTVEFWWYPRSTADQNIVGKWDAGGSEWIIQWRSLGYYRWASNGNVISDSNTLTLAVNSWNHIAITKSGSSLRIYSNGSQINTTGTEGAITATSAALTIGASQLNSSPGYVTGYITDVRILKGVVGYTGNFAPPINLLKTSGATSAASYPSTTNVNISFAESATSLLTLQTRAATKNHGIIDTSPNEFIVTRSGSVSQGTFSPFSPGGWSYYYNGSSSHSVSNNSDFQFGTGDFSVELWLNKTIASTSVFTRVFSIASMYSSAGKGVELERSHPGGSLEVVISGDSSVVNNIVFTSTEAEWTNSWNHVVITRSGGVLKGFWNGVLKGSLSNSTNINGTGGLRLGDAIGGTLPFTGFVSDFKIVKGAVPTLYQTSSTTIGATIFTPPTSPVSWSTGTVFLTAQSNRFFEITGKTLTNNGTPQVQPISPFRPTSTTQPLVTGGSAYFDGNDYLDIPIANSSVFDIVGAFSLECWFYYTSSSPGNSAIIGKGGGASGWGTTNGNQWALLTDSGSLYWMVNNGSGGNWSISTTTPASFTWHHLAISYSGTTTRVWLNGSSIGTNTSSYGAPTTRNMLRVGVLALTTPGYYHTGYISGLRFVQGQDLYNINNTNIVIPTAPPAATQNTSLLLNFTNSGIVDATGRHVLETVGNSHKSTSQVKFAGTASEYFDGTSDYLAIRDNPLLELGSGDFTIEAWVYPLNNSSRSIFGHGPDGQNWWAFYLDGTGKLEFAIVSGNSVIVDRISSTTVNTNTWTHVAVTRSSTTFRLFIDGQEPTSYTGSPATTSAAAPDFSTDFWIGGQRWSGSGNGFQGYIQDLRITRGVARYTSNFTINTTIPAPFRIG